MTNFRLSIAVLRMRVERGELVGVKVEDLVDHYVGSRAKSTLSTYAAAYKKVVEHMLVSGRSLFRWGEGEVMGLMFQLGKEGAGENMLKQVLAVVALVFECMGKVSPTRSALVLQVKKTCLKKCLERKAAAAKPLGAKRVGCTLQDMMKIIKDIYVSNASVADPCRRRFLVMQVLLFFGVKRYSDIAMLTVGDVSFLKDGSVEVTVRKSKTDQLGRGAKFYLSGEKVGGVGIPDIIKWYVRGLRLEGTDFLFPKLRYERGVVVAIKDQQVSYGAAASQLKAEVARLKLNNISLHSGRIGGATQGALAGLSHQKMKAVGGWKSSASVDLYTRLERPGVEFSSKMMKRLGRQL